MEIQPISEKTLDKSRPEKIQAQDPTAKQPPSGWRLLSQGLQVRLRFVLAIASLGIVMAMWPWLRGAWETAIAKFSPYNPDFPVSEDREFFCPMDPGVVSVWPANCPICNMPLSPRRRSDAGMLPEGVVARMQMTPYRIQLAGIRTVPVQQLTIGEEPEPQQVLRVPITAVVSRGAEKIVYVETMPGMYEGVLVTLGPRDSDFYQVVGELQVGQPVVAINAFLLDAESRLNPSLSIQYFVEQLKSDPKPPLAKRPPLSKELVSLLSKDDLELVALQRFCPVRQAPLGSMGLPIIVRVGDRKVALCCDGCTAKLRADPEPFLRWLDEILKTEDVSNAKPTIP